MQQLCPKVMHMKEKYRCISYIWPTEHLGVANLDRVQDTISQTLATQCTVEYWLFTL